MSKTRLELCHPHRLQYLYHLPGWDLRPTRPLGTYQPQPLQPAQRIDHLILAMAIAILWCHELGEFVLKHGEPARCLVDPAHERTLTLFQLGLRWLKRILATGLHFLPDFQALLSNLKLKPVVIPVTQNSLCKVIKYLCWYCLNYYAIFVTGFQVSVSKPDCVEFVCTPPNMQMNKCKRNEL